MSVSDDFERPQPLVSYLIETHGSTIEFASIVEFHGLVWDSVDVDWDDTAATWDGVALAAQPAFQATAFQFDAFQTSAVISVEVTQTAPAFTQTLVGLSAKIATVTQELAAFTQSAALSVVDPTTATQTVAAFAQDAAVALTVRGAIGVRVQTFQADAFQDDAFQTQADAAVDAPAFTQHLSGGVVEHGTTIVIIAQVAAAFSQSLDAAQAVEGGISQVVGAFTQSASGEQPSAGSITQTAPGFLQAAIGSLTVNAEGTITQTAPAFAQTLRVALVRWPEWGVGTGDEWLVSTDDEWLVRQ